MFKTITGNEFLWNTYASIDFMWHILTKLRHIAVVINSQKLLGCIRALSCLTDALILGAYWCYRV